ncbi:cell cycle checkpoint control protein RAD9A isoform X2 [Cuculus canorus]|uniref:cell cycle checkpoint control protein RAD9A isoform X2 n=1 Tax=Cuculus canorus TaxID=55661 RepID=UPI0023AA7D20|nr:cell cycle checkpoint control protein RAD9A isoform X2 [Cuculus canorus]
MKCIITGSNVKVLGRAVHSLSRIGDELYLEPTESGSFLGVFRSLPSLDKTVGQCLILLRPRANRLVVQLHCKHGVTRTHNLAFQECEQLQALFDTQHYGSSLCAPARVLAEAVLHFSPAQAEVTLGTGSGDRIGLRSHVEDMAEPSKAMMTELWLGRDEFQAVAVAPGSHVTFCLKEFRALLTFAEASNLPLTIHYDTPGRPVVVTLEDTVLEVHLVLATLSDLESSSQPAQTNHISHLAAPSDDDLESYMIALETSANEGGSGVPPSPTFPLRTPRSALSDPEDEDDEAAVPGTPPHKKFRSLFFGSVLTPGGPGPAPSQEVLAEDSDGEY